MFLSITGLLTLVGLWYAVAGREQVAETG
jgi:hypothetical protein